MGSDLDTLKAIRKKEEESELRLKSAREKANTILEEAKMKADKIVEEATKEGEKYLNDYLNNVRTETENEIKKLISDNASKIASLKREVTPDLIEELLKIITG